MRRKGIWAVAAASALTLLSGGVAYADNVVNNVVVGGSDTIVAGGSTTVGYRINAPLAANKNDPQAGCNIEEGSFADLAITTPMGVTASPSSLRFTACGAFQYVTFTSTTTGTHAITHNVVDSGVGVYNTTDANWTLTVTAPPAPADTTPPVLSLPAAPLVVEATGPSGAVVTYDVSASDDVDKDVQAVCSPASGGTFPLGTTRVTCSATDAARNSISGFFDVTVQDTTKPTDITFSATGVQDGGSYLRNFVPAAPTCTATDIVDPSPACVVTGYSTLAGTHTLTATATDAAGNSDTRTISYTVRTLTVGAFGAPVDGGTTLNSIKGGNTVPLKFTIHDGTQERTDTAVVKGFSATKVTCDAKAAVDEVEEFATTGSTSLRYDTTQFIQNWKTPTGSNTCYRVVVTAIDDSTTVAFFKLK